METDSELSQQLKNKRICRFCMTLEEPLSNIYSAENRVNCRAPLPLQIMACVSIEVFTNDGMPCTICNPCRLLMDHSYRFKQMCKKADTALKQYPLTGAWAKKLDHPIYPPELLEIQQAQPLPTVSISPTPSIGVKRDLNTNDSFPPVKRQKIQQPSQPQIASISEYKELLPSSPPKESSPQQKSKLIKVEPSSQSNHPKILNKNTVKILNINAPGKNSEPIISKPVVKTDELGNVEVVSCEILEQVSDDSVLNASPVETNVFPCDHCERSFPLRQLLEIHMNNHVRERNFVCPICDKAFFSKYDLGKHSLIHTGERPYVCIVCNKAFSRTTLLARHEKIHTDQPKFLCVFCERPFLSKTELDKHTERHKKRRPFPCKVCGKSFAFKQGLERHEVVHSNNQPYRCDHCDKSFSTPSKLARHLTAHAGQRPYPCRLCPKSYLLSHHLTRHIRSHKDGSGSYKCFDCELVFTSRDELIYHSAVHATQSLMCPLCKEKFSNLDGVTQHIKSHTEGEQYACEFCDLIFTTEEKLKSHSDAKHMDEQAAYVQDLEIRNIKMEIDIDEESIAGEYIIEKIPKGRKKTPRAGRKISHTSNKSYEEMNDMEAEKDIEYDDSDLIDELDQFNNSAELLDVSESPVLNRTKKEVRVFKAKNKQKPNSPNVIVEKDTVRPILLQKIDLQHAIKTIPKGITITKKDQTLSHSTDAQKSGYKVLSQTIVKNATKPLATKKAEIVKTLPMGKNTSQKTISTKSPTTTTPSTNKQVQMKIGDEPVRLQRVKMTKAQVAAMAREGKIEVKGGQVYLKHKRVDT